MDSVSSSYGAAGSFAVLLVWINFSSMILFFGAEFTQVFSRSRDSRKERLGHPADRAVADGAGLGVGRRREG